MYVFKTNYSSHFFGVFLICIINIKIIQFAVFEATFLTCFTDYNEICINLS